MFEKLLFAVGSIALVSIYNCGPLWRAAMLGLTRAAEALA